MLRCSGAQVPVNDKLRGLLEVGVCRVPPCKWGDDDGKVVHRARDRSLITRRVVRARVAGDGGEAQRLQPWVTAIQATEGAIPVDRRVSRVSRPMIRLRLSNKMEKATSRVEDCLFVTRSGGRGRGRNSPRAFIDFRAATVSGLSAVGFGLWFCWPAWAACVEGSGRLRQPIVFWLFLYLIGPH